MSKQSETASQPAAKKPKVNKKTAMYNIAMELAGMRTAMPPFPTNIALLEDDAGLRRHIEINPDMVCRYVDPEYVEAEITRYYIKHVRANAKLDLLPNDFGAIRKIAQSLGRPTPEEGIKPVLQKSTDGLCWHRLPWDAAPGDTPLFDSMMDRTENADAVQAWIGSLFHPQADTQQYLWLYGPGGNGKGSIFNMLHRILGPSYASEQVPDASMRRFWTYGILSKRLVVFPDCNNASFPKSGFFKSLSGGDSQRVEIKGGKIFTTFLHAKFAFLSNERPNITSSTADKRRAIYAEMAPLDTEPLPAKVINETLWKEAPSILYKCLGLYKSKTGAGANIETNGQCLELIIENNEERYQRLFDKCFVAAPDAKLAPSKFLDIMDEIGPFDHRFVHSFKQWLERRYGIKQKRVGSNPRMYHGIGALETKFEDV